MMNTQKIQPWIPTILFAAALAVRVLCALPGLSAPEMLCREDSATYLGPALSMLEGKGYLDVTLSPTALRVPGYPFVLAVSLWLGGLQGAILFGCVISAFTVLMIYAACRTAGTGTAGAIFGAAVYMLTPTPLAFAPMFLSDSLFAAVTAAEGLLLLKFFRTKNGAYLLGAGFAGGFGALVRPLNLLWILPCLFAAFFVHGISYRKKAFFLAGTLLIFCAFPIPWICRNHAIHAGWRIDAVSADSLKHNAAIAAGRAENRDPGELRREYDAHFEKVFRESPEKFPDADSRLTYQETYLSGILKQHFSAYLKSFCRPVNFVPDVPTLLENLGVSNGGKGTADVIARQGIFAGVRHYFQGKTVLLYLTAPMVLLLLAGYLFAAGTLVSRLRWKAWNLPLLFIPLWLYYALVTGAVAYPRFSLPGLPYLCVLAACGLELCLAKWRNHHAEIL